MANHWSHINVLDFGRGIQYIYVPADKTTASNWFADRIDVTENAGDEIKTRNPSIQVFQYDYDSTICHHVGAGWYASDWSGAEQTANPELSGLPENYFLHFTDETTIDLYHFGVFWKTIVIPAGGRVQTLIWDDTRYIYNPKIADWQTWMINRLITNVGTKVGIFLDEHGPGWFYINGGDAVLVSGGKITEYGDKLPDSAQLDIDYNADVVTWLGNLKTALTAVGKWCTVNTAGYSTSQLCIDRAVAVGGFHLETLCRPDNEEYGQNLLIAGIKSVIDAGGKADTFSSTAYYGPTGYTAGLYSSAAARYRMWRLAFYYIVKEAVGSSGMVYFDPTLYIQWSDPAHWLDFFNEWETAFETNVGLPTDLQYTYQTGNNPARLPTIVPYKIRARDYTNALILLRTMDSWSSTEFDDPGAVTVNLPEGSWYLLNANGTRGSAITSVQLRDAEAVILMKSQAAPIIAIGAGGILTFGSGGGIII